jgi:hypothetical protein
MEAVSILLVLWRNRLLVVAVLVFAQLAGLMAGYKLPPFASKVESRQYTVGTATVRILVDTPMSQVVEVSPKGVDTLGSQANLLANLMVEGVVKSSIAQRAGLKDTELIGVSESAVGEPGTPPVPTTTARTGHILSTNVLTNTGGATLPIIEIKAQAPDAAAAGKLAAAAVVSLRDYVDQRANAGQVPDQRRLRVSAIGPPQTETVSRGPGRVMILAVVIFVFCLGCGVIVTVSAMRRMWVTASQQEDVGDLLFGPEDEPEDEPFDPVDDWTVEPESEPEPEPDEEPAHVNGNGNASADDWLSPRKIKATPPV